MTLNFCPDCKNILIPRNGENGKFIFCSQCGYVREVSKDLISKEKIKNSKIFGGVVEDKNIYADYEHECEKCGYKKSQVIDMGVFVSDEDNLIFLKCGKCGHVERIGRRTS